MQDPLAPVLMTLAGLAYGKPSAIPAYLANDVVTNGQWTSIWVPEEVPDPINFAFIAKNTKDGSYVIAIRGTYPNPFSPAYWSDASQDNPLGTMRAWPLDSQNAPEDGPKVSRGTAEAFQNLLSLSNGTQSLQEAVLNIQDATQIYVTGHSLGGTLAPVIALWLTGSRNNGPVPNVYCFAGMTPGNQAFAALFDTGSALAGRVVRYKNTLDSVPYGWNDILATRDFYQPAPSGGLLVEALIASLAVNLAPYDYAAIGQEIDLPGVLQQSSIAFEFIAFIMENLHQHMPNTYLDLLGAPCLPFNLVLSTLVVPRQQHLAPLLETGRTPVYYV